MVLREGDGDGDGVSLFCGEYLYLFCMNILHLQEEREKSE